MLKKHSERDLKKPSEKGRRKKRPGNEKKNAKVKLPALDGGGSMVYGRRRGG